MAVAPIFLVRLRKCAKPERTLSMAAAEFWYGYLPHAEVRSRRLSLEARTVIWSILRGLRFAPAPQDEVVA
jgi:hypothetical protein